MVGTRGPRDADLPSTPSIERQDIVSNVNENSGKSILVAAAVGAVIGAGVALLLAPRSGKETRAWLAQRTRELQDRTTNAFEQGKESVLRAAKEIGKEAGANGPSSRL
jgi:gas vesicle protein